ncbi:BTAD domain-containing putative transcriptional regulator [Streptomyces sp. Y7]|uniref:BTAD domain-containing putative transcriptional regulator n=1 Tax=Streptomyces sp. Y7 TaxID=3342392 RepID=UPI0037129377
MQFKLLGPVEVLHDEQPLPLGGSKPRTLLTALLLADGRAVSEARLGSMLWDDRPPRTRRAQIHTYVSRLRKLLAPYADVERTRAGYSLHPHEGTLDLGEFRRRVELGHEEARRERHAEASAHLAAALDMWRGPALGGTTDYLVDAERPRLEEARLAALEDRVDADLAQGGHSRILTELGGLVEEHPLRERLRAQLMTALYRCGRQADALETCQRGRDLLAAAGLRCGPVLDRVFHAILNADPDLDARASGPAYAMPRQRLRAARPCLLPPDVAGFTGRDALLEELGRRLGPAASGPLVISGAVGVGKSGLAVRLAHRCLDDFPDGQLYVDVDSMPPGPGRTRAALGRLVEALDPDGTLPDSVEERGGLYRALVTDRRVLVVVDGAADEAEVRPLLPGLGQARVIVTARARMAALGGAHRADLAEFTAQEAMDLLRRIVGVPRVAAEPDAAEHLMGLCEYLPGAVHAAGARLAARPHWTLDRLVRRLRDASRNRLEELRVSDLDLRTGLARACRDLPAELLAPLTRLAFLTERRISVPEAARALALPEHEAEDLLESLADAQAVRAVVRDRSDAIDYKISEFLAVYLREQHAKSI